MRIVTILGLQEPRSLIRRKQLKVAARSKIGKWILVLIAFLSVVPSWEVAARAQEEQDAGAAPANQAPAGEVNGGAASPGDSSQEALSPAASNPEKRTVKNKDVYKIQVGDRVSGNIPITVSTR